MSIRVKSLLLVVSIVIAITGANFAASFFFTRQSLMDSIKGELTLSRDIADDLVSTRINLFKADAQTVAGHIKNIPPDQMTPILRENLDTYPNFLAFTVFNRVGVLAQYGDLPTSPQRLRESAYLQRAFQGESVMSTTRYDIETGVLVMHVCVPVQKDTVLSVTIPGTFFADLMKNYHFWKTGNIFMIDEEGIMIADSTDHMVKERYNFIERGKTEKASESIGAFFQRMIDNDNGYGTYYLNGVKRLCTFKHVTSSVSGWKLGVAAPLVESPASNVSRDLLFASMIFLVVGFIIALFVSKVIAQPFYQIEKQKKHLERLNNEVLAASEAKSNFLANMSHEMRTPLNAIIGLSELTLGSGEVEGETEENLSKIYNSGVTLLGLINSILDLSKIEAGKLEIIPVDYDTPSLINDTVSLNSVYIGSKPIEFCLDIDSSLSAMLHGDDLRVKEVFNNLLSNAFKYTKEGQVIWKLNTVREGKHVWLISSITDTGIGIKHEDIPKLFSDYTQVDTKSNRKIEGTGLGLTIMKRLVEMMDGGITVESEYGKGTTFTVRLKQDMVNDTTIGKEVVKKLQTFKYADHRRDRSSKLLRARIPYARVLVVDDVITNLDVARGIMKPYGMQVDCVTSGPDAIAAIKEEKVRYNAVFMDHMMPGMDGIEATRIIRGIGTDYAQTVPIIALTANAIVGNKEMFLASGFQAFLSKPIDINAMDQAINHWVRDKDKEKELGVGGSEEALSDETSSPGESTLELIKGAVEQLSVKGVETAAGLDHFGGDETIYLDVIRSFAKNTPPLLERIRIFREEALADYRVIVHGIKSSGRSIGAMRVGDQAEALENAAKGGDVVFITSHHQQFIKSMDTLLGMLASFLEELDAAITRPVKEEPDRTTLEALKKACENYDMTEVDRMMEDLERYSYTSGGDLVIWLREQVDVTEFSGIVERLDSMMAAA